MGWWKIANTEDVVGDDVFNITRDAFHAIAREYRSAFGREPTASEWQHLLHDSLQPDEDLDGVIHAHLIHGEARPTAVSISVESVTEQSTAAPATDEDR